MMVCMPRTCGVLLRTLSVLGRGWHWCAEARAALRTQTDWELKEGISPQSPTLPLQAGGGSGGPHRSVPGGGYPPSS